MGRDFCSPAGNIQRWRYLDYWIDGWIIGTDSGSVFSWRYTDRVGSSDDLFGQIRGAYLGGSILAFFLGYSMLFFKGGILASIYPFSAALILVGFDMSGYAGTTTAPNPLLAVIGVGIMVLWAVLLLLMSSNKKEIKSISKCRIYPVQIDKKELEAKQIAERR